MARSGIEAVNATERLICGEGAVDVASVAQGLSLAGQRAATLLADGRSQPPAHMVAGSTAAWVHHQLGGGHTVVGGCMTFELDAGDAFFIPEGVECSATVEKSVRMTIAVIKPKINAEIKANSEFSKMV